MPGVMGLMRTALLAASQNSWLSQRAPRYAFVRRAVARFMPGEDPDAALAAADTLRPQKIGAVLTRLGENIREPAEAEGVARHYLEVLALGHKNGRSVEISVKPTQLGLDLSRDDCERHLATLADAVTVYPGHGNPTTIGAERSWLPE